MVKENYDKVMENINNALIKSNRKLEELTILGVTKTIEIERMEELFDCGIKSFGENKVQEFISKKAEINRNIDWHFIGHLQRNKVKSIVGEVSLIHSVDSFRLAEKINEIGKAKGIKQDVLIEINLCKEESKYGIYVSELDFLMEKMLFLDNISIKGFMTIPPNVQNSEENRKVFYKMRQVFVDKKQTYKDNVSMDVLSMGMSGDYPVAIEEGATTVRIGRGFFGERTYK